VGALIQLLACTGSQGAAGAGLLAEDFVAEELFMEFVTTPDDTGEAQQILHLRSDSGLWSLRLGERWSEAEPQGQLAVALEEEGYKIDGALVLPARLTVGQTTEGTTVSALGELEVWYGTFPMVASVEVSEGFEGAHHFAEGIGPVRLELYDRTWDLAYYE